MKEKKSIFRNDEVRKETSSKIKQVTESKDRFIVIEDDLAM